MFGWFKFAYKSKDNPKLAQAVPMGIWSHLLCRTYHQGKLLNNGLEMQRGEILISEVSFSEDMGVSRKVMRRVLDSFVTDGMIQVIKRDRNGTHLSVCNWEVYQAKRKAKGTATEQQRNINGTATEHERDLNAPQSKNVKNVKNVKNIKALRFDDFWKAYPKKAAKKAASTSYAKAVKSIQGSHDDPEGYLIERAKAYAKSDKGIGDPRFILNPTTWLNQGRYDDDPATWQTGTVATAKPNGRPSNLDIAASFVERHGG